MPTTENGTEWKVLRGSKGAVLEDGDNVGAFYEGWVIGPGGLPLTRFDGNFSFERAFTNTGDIFAFDLGQGDVINGWDEALEGRRVGQVLELRLPADQAYGDVPRTLIPAGSDLLFKVFIYGKIAEGETDPTLYSLRDLGLKPAQFGDLRDRLEPFEGIERIGYNGRDVMNGTEEAEAIIGLKGKDVITGGDSGDVLIGGAGRDRFVFEDLADSTRDDPDAILDLQRRDRVDLRALNEQLADAGLEEFAFDGSTNRLTGEAGQLVYHKRQDVLRGDVDGDGQAEFVVEFALQGINNLTENHLLL